MPRFRLTPPALASLKSIGRYTGRMWGKTQRDKYLRALDRRFHELAKSPGKGRSRDELWKGLRSYREGKHVIFYFAERKEIIIADILHERMEPSLHLEFNA
jgi:toxin ParE1/3/4